jgi:agmatinase
MTAAEQSDAIEGTVTAVARHGAVPLILGGDDGILPAVLAGLAGAHVDGAAAAGLALVAIGIDVLPHWRGGPSIHLAPSRRPAAEALAGIAEAGGFLASAAELRALGAPAVRDRIVRAVHGTSVHVALDMSGFAATWHGMHQRAAFDGLSLGEARELLEAIGTLPVVGLSITGLDPTGSGLSVVKTGQRLILTAVLDLIYARLDALRFNADTPNA